MNMGIMIMEDILVHPEDGPLSMKLDIINKIKEGGKNQKAKLFDLGKDRSLR